MLSARDGVRQHVRPLPTNVPACENIGKPKLTLKKIKLPKTDQNSFLYKLLSCTAPQPATATGALHEGLHERGCKEAMGEMVGWGHETLWCPGKCKSQCRYSRGSGAVLASSASPSSPFKSFGVFFFGENPIPCPFQMAGEKVSISVLRLSQGVLQQI